MTIETFNQVIELIQEGSSLRAACRDLKASTTSFNDIINRDEEQALRYAHAREERNDVIFEEILDIADDSSKDRVVKTDEEGNELYAVENKEFVNRSKVRIDARKWMLGKMNANKYGDKTQVDSTNRNINLDATANTDEEIRALAKKLRDDI
jgi:hypothetical protein